MRDATLTNISLESQTKENPDRFHPVPSCSARHGNRADAAAGLLAGGNSRDFASGARRLAAGEVVNINEHLAGIMLRYEVTPLIMVNGMAIVAPHEPSAHLSPGLSYSLSDDADLLVGALFALGQLPDAASGLPRSEFGAYKHIAYAEWKACFWGSRLAVLKGY